MDIWRGVPQRSKGINKHLLELQRGDVAGKAPDQADHVPRPQIGARGTLGATFVTIVLGQTAAWVGGAADIKRVGAVGGAEEIHAVEGWDGLGAHHEQRCVAALSAEDTKISLG